MIVKRGTLISCVLVHRGYTLGLKVFEILVIFIKRDHLIRSNFRGFLVRYVFARTGQFRVVCLAVFSVVRGRGVNNVAWLFCR